MRKGDKGKKVFGVIVILAIIVSVFGGVASAEDLSEGLKQSIDDAEIQTAVDEEGYISNPVTRSPEKHAIIPSKNASRSTVSLSSNTYYVPDNYAKIQWAVDNASDGDTIIVRDGTYIENVNVDKRLTIRSENGPETTIVQAAKSIGAVFSVSSDYVNISGFTVASGLGSNGIDIRPSCSNVCIAGNIISQNYIGIKTWFESNNNNIRDNTISSNEHSGIRVIMGSSNIITGNTISDNGDDGIEIWDSSNNFISDNTISNNGAGVGISFDSTGNTISGNSISSNNGSGIWMSGAGGFPSDNTLSSNTVSNNNGPGIIFTTGTDNIVTNNIVSNNNKGIIVFCSTNNQITNNAVLNSRGYGIHVNGNEKSDFDNFIDTTNTVNGKPIYYYFDESNKVIDGLDTTHLTLAYCSNFRVINSDINNGDGVYLPHSNNNLFDGNDISTNNVDGIYLPYSDDNSISDNIISSNSDHGIHLWGSDTNEITGNTVSNNDDGIWLWDSSDNNIIADNKILSNNAEGVYLGWSDDNEITGNTISNNNFGIYVFEYSDYNSIYHNDFTDNTNQAYDLYFTGTNSWDNGPVDGGNYWNDHICIGNPSNGAYPYFIGGDANAIDHYPFQDPIGTPKECDDTDTSCGIYPNCENCDEKDGCYEYGNGCEERDYYCVSNEAGCDYTYSNRHTDDWVDTDNTKWVEVNECQEKERKEQEYRDYACSNGVCTYSVTDTQWLDTGNTRNKDDGTICGCTANNTLKTCYDGICTDTGICNSTNCSADAACDGKKPGESCGAGKICNSSCKCVSIAPPEITFFAPPSHVDDTVCNWRTFNVTVNQMVNVSWYLNGTFQFTNESVREAKCTLHAAVAGEHNVTANASNVNGTDTQTWIWNVTKAVGNPDLIITEKWLCWPDNCTICYNVTNIGTETAPACHNTTLYVDDVAVAHDHVPVDLAPGESYTGCFNGYVWTYTPPSGNITVCADNNESLDELDEDNNCLTNIWMCGDVTGDGRVRTSDGRRIFRHLTFGVPIDNMWAADVTGDGRVRTSDGRRIFRHLTFGDPLNCNCSG